MPSTNVRKFPLSNRNPRAFSYTFEPSEEKRRDALLRAAFLQIFAGFKCRPHPRGPIDETASGDLTPWNYLLGLMRNAMATAVVNGDHQLVEQTQEGIRAFCRELEADVTSMVPAREEESPVQTALAETDSQSAAEPLEMAFVANPSPVAAERAVGPLQVHADRLDALVRRLRVYARKPVTPWSASLGGTR